MTVVGIVCALASEARHLGRRTTGPSIGNLDDGTLLAVSGIGSVRAAASARQLTEAGATALLSWGMAGGLDPALEPGTILLPEVLLGPDGGRVETAAVWRTRLNGIASTLGTVAPGALLTLPSAVRTAREKAALYRDTGAAAVDMESLAVARVALERGLPFVALRVIVDKATDELPRAVEEAIGASGEVRIGRLLGSLATGPGQLWPLMHLARRYGAANRALSALARAGQLGAGCVGLGTGGSAA